MKRGIVLLASAVLALPVVGATSSAAPGADDDELDVYTLRVDVEEVGDLQRSGLDVVDSRYVGDDVVIDAVLSAGERDRLRERGVNVQVKRNRDGKSQKQLAVEQAASGFTVWRSFDEPGGIRDELYELARRNPQLIKLEVLGHTHEGREIIALKVTQGARSASQVWQIFHVPEADRPAPDRPRLRASTVPVRPTG